MSPAPYSGDPARLNVLHPHKPAIPAPLTPLPEDIQSPTTSPEDFYVAVCSASRATAQTSDGWHTDMLKDVNVRPTEECPDPLYGIRIFCTSYAAGGLPISPELYLTMSGSKIAAIAKPGRDDPRPVGIRGVFDRIGMRTLLKCQQGDIAEHFGSQGEFGCGIEGVCQKLSWLFTLYKEKHPGALQFWADVSNGYNEMRRTAIADGLADLPPPLQWLRRSFSAFYSGDVVLYFQRDGETYHVVSEIGTVQGDAASGIFFNAGLQRAFNQLRAEYPEALLAKYADDVNGAVVGTHTDDGMALRVNVNE